MIKVSNNTSSVVFSLPYLGREDYLPLQLLEVDEDSVHFCIPDKPTEVKIKEVKNALMYSLYLKTFAYNGADYIVCKDFLAKLMYEGKFISGIQILCGWFVSYEPMYMGWFRLSSLVEAIDAKIPIDEKRVKAKFVKYIPYTDKKEIKLRKILEEYNPNVEVVEELVVYKVVPLTKNTQYNETPLWLDEL